MSKNGERIIAILIVVAFLVTSVIHVSATGQTLIEHVDENVDVSSN